MRKRLRNDLIKLDGMGCVRSDTAGSDHLFQLIAEAYEHKPLSPATLAFRTGGRLYDQPWAAAAF